MRFLAALFLLLALAVPSLAREEIRSMVSDVTLATDGSVQVVETLVVNAEGDQIRRGIFRDIPVTMLGDSGNKIRIALDVESVTRNGQAEQFDVEREGDFRRIRIGNPDALLRPGEQRYVITYRLERMARPSADGDEIYWNATGNYWNFPILNAEARVHLPAGAVIANMAVYTGPLGSTARDAAIKRVSDNEAVFRSQTVLQPGEGMSVAVSFQKGIVSYPEGMDALAQSASDLREVILPILAVLLVLGYNLIAWNKVGRDPPKGTIIPLFHPPEGFSPALTHYVHRWGFANSGWTALTAAIFSLGVKGLVTIYNPDKTLTVVATDKQAGGELPAGERVLYGYFSSKRSVTIDKANGVELGAKRTEFVKAIESENRQLWFRNNTGYAVFSFVLSAACLGLMVLFDVLDPIYLVGAAFFGVFAGIIGSLMMSAFKSGIIQKVIVGVWVGIVLFNMGGGFIESLTSITINNAAIAAASLIIISVVFAALMRAPTIQGRKVMDQIEGFKLYLETAEKNRLNINDEPPMTVERFERILPYAIALDVEKPWSEHFEAELARNAVPETTANNYSPNWYAGSRSFSSGGLSKAISTATTGMAAAMVAAQPVQASSSGSSGGGFSGGGGGGGGGGGW
ncbi:DUF2207 domain-containing protein [Devosia sp. 63-57]|nr:DUF2207 domain-containing protein [Devosia sp. 63-57]ODT48394.1 MAG: hypothetical protein ABS74_14685 [Pelagibacterium sp. SCN 63-126]ODU86174.1 MAG: hypothetical protein ABT14_10120 [Pelagibacterium sp. SCN 63-17]OJX43665.1 MAG: hypothetical protein BGO80_15180 [Devosia sp. 63-57]